jgi:hypothetical protein
MSDIQKISVALTGEQVATLKAAVDAGEYATTSTSERNWGTHFWLVGLRYPARGFPA